MTNEFVCSVCQELLLQEQRRPAMNYSCRGDARPSLPERVQPGAAPLRRPGSGPVTQNNNN